MKSLIRSEAAETDISTSVTAPRGGENRILRWIRVHREVRRLSILFAIIASLEAIVFGRFFTGAAIPPWDFLGSYSTGAFAWWENGTFFNPSEWVPNSLAGYPAALSIQDSSWYLPVGVAAFFGPFTLQAAAIVAALHVALGSVGTYALVRSLRLPFGVAALAGVSGFFAVGYLSNAQHVDIARGYALVPWILLVMSSRWPWRNVWAVPLATLILWQAAIGMYPGMLFSTVYVGIVWVVVSQLVERPAFRAYLLPMALSALGAILLCAPKLVPYFLLSSTTVGALPDESRFDLSLIGTLLFGYGHLEGPNELTMNSLFVPATVLVLACFANFRDRASKAALAIGVPSLVLGMPFFPWFLAAQTLPGLGFSRFGMSDFKVFIVLASVLLAASGANRLACGVPLPVRAFWTRFGVAVGIAIALFSLRKEGAFTRLDWLPGFVVLLVVLVAVAMWRLRGKGRRPAAFLTGMLALTVVSGCVWAFTTTVPWSTPRTATERATYGATVDELLALRPSAGVVVQRPARISLPEEFDAGVLFSPAWNGNYYAERDAIGGYVNIKSSETSTQIATALLDPATGKSVAAFMAAPGLVLSGNVTPASMGACARAAECGPADTTPITYTPGDLTYRVSSPTSTAAVLNEAYYPGWIVTACAEDDCAVLEADRSVSGLIQTMLPAGDYDLRVEYKERGRAEGWLIFAAGLIVAAVGGSLQYFRDGSNRRKIRKAATTTE
ncbi:hypothetical protein E3T61_07740 [Cryobacterium lactosi]|uniref:YfhO family protein n=1 Tax=Cryobacterium lactosi TaxID=1259202 RepID=A0A4R9BWT2_9MICO|nr:hypothetical protein [Cryobacterium lactosi]TFD91859.1 hypothetical protein E3T61_07740 [Cryobacterium lactosi]